MYHYINSSTVFSGLFSYDDQELWEEHPVVQFDTLASMGSYSIFEEFYSEVYSVDRSGFHYYRYTDLQNIKNFDAYIDHVKATALYGAGVTAKYGNQLLTFSI